MVQTCEEDMYILFGKEVCEVGMGGFNEGQRQVEILREVTGLDMMQLQLTGYMISDIRI